MKKRVMVVFLAMVMVLASVLVVNAGSEEWSDDWGSALVSAGGSASCTTYGADADSGCYANGSVIETRTSISASFDYRNMETGALYTVSDYDTNSTFSSVGFSAPNNCEGIYLSYSYSS